MKCKNFKFFSLSLFSLFSLTVFGQYSINSSGGDASGSGGYVAYSIGQVVYTTHSSTSGTKSQGVQQAYEIFTLDTREVTADISLLVYPNPTADNLTLQLGSEITENLSYQLFDLQGRLLQRGEVNTRKTQIYTSGLPSGVCKFIIKCQNSKDIHNFEISK